MSLRFERLYGVMSLQGRPRPGLRRYGVPPGGAFDQSAYRLANALVGNRNGELCLELGLASGLAVASSQLRLAIVGAEALVEEEHIESGSAFDLDAGARLEVMQPLGARAYLAVQGGWASIKDRMMAQTSMAQTFGGVAVIPWKPDALSPFRVIGSGEVPTASYEVTLQLDRVGIRLSGPPFAADENLVSEPCVPGVLQATGDGLILHGPDGPTIGGYAKLGVVCSADFDRLAQLKPGDEVTFEAIDLDEARALDEQRRSWLEELVRQALELSRA